jgi:hypothetical protein
MKIRRLVLCTALLLTACGGTQTSLVVTGRPSASYTGQVAVIMDGATLPSNFEEVGIVQAIGHGDEADMPHVIEGLRQKAASLGCDTVIRVKVDQGVTIASGTGVAIRTLAASPAPAPAQPSSGASTP